MDAMFLGKKIVNTHLKVTAKDKVSYGLIRDGPWLDMGRLPQKLHSMTNRDLALKATLGADLATKKMTLYTKETVRLTPDYYTFRVAIISILSDPFPYSNRIIYVHNFIISQGEPLPVVEKQVRSRELDVNELGGAAMDKEGRVQLGECALRCTSKPLESSRKRSLG